MAGALGTGEDAGDFLAIGEGDGSSGGIKDEAVDKAPGNGGFLFEEESFVFLDIGKLLALWGLARRVYG